MFAVAVGKGSNDLQSRYTSGFQKLFSHSLASPLLTLSISPPTCWSEDMGFFSSKQAEDNNVYKVTVGLRGGRHGGNDKSLVQVIRSRFVRSLLLVQCRIVTHAKKNYSLIIIKSVTVLIFISAVLLVRQKEQRARRPTTATYHFISGWRLGSAGPIS